MAAFASIFESRFTIDKAVSIFGVNSFSDRKLEYVSLDINGNVVSRQKAIIDFNYIKNFRNMKTYETKFLPNSDAIYLKF